MIPTPHFDRYIGVEYSGAETPTQSLTNQRIYIADRNTPPQEVDPPPSCRKYWTRSEIANRLAMYLLEDRPTLVGLNHGFCFPLFYFLQHDLQVEPPNWTAFLEDFQRHWPTDEDNMYVDFIREAVYGNGDARRGARNWRRLTEMRGGVRRAAFNFDRPGSGAKATHAGLPWLLYLRRRTPVHFWPFDGWQTLAGRSVVAEVDVSLWKKQFAREDRTVHQRNAFSIATWLRDRDADGSLVQFFTPDLKEGERGVAEIEGWILGVS